MSFVVGAAGSDILPPCNAFQQTFLANFDWSFSYLRLGLLLPEWVGWKSGSLYFSYGELPFKNPLPHCLNQRSDSNAIPGPVVASSFLPFENLFFSQEGGKGQIDSKVEEVDEVNYDTISGEESLAGPSLMGCPPPPLWC